MKHTKQWIALLLAVVMTAALLSVPAFAKAPNDLGIETYVALGDSIATGLNDNTGTNEEAYGSWASTTSFEPMFSVMRSASFTSA